MHPDSLAREMVAFANSQGRTILLGVNYEAQIEGSDVNKNLFLVRVGSTSRVVSQAELMRLFQQAEMFYFDLTTVSRSTIKDLNFNKIASYFQRY